MKIELRSQNMMMVETENGDRFLVWDAGGLTIAPAIPGDMTLCGGRVIEPVSLGLHEQISLVISPTFGAAKG